MNDPRKPRDSTSKMLASTVTGDPLPERVGAVIGPYKLMEQIGAGGFGLVFVAEQQHPVRRKVALKVIKPGMDTREVIARFAAERQALALMDHPNIARVLDAGATDSGRPYFVMELVRGIPITGYCDQNQLTPRERLELFIAVCQAVQHAHQKGIIHRDIKPSNVLVALHDGRPIVKVIDFGVAKALHQSLTEKTIYTRFAQMIGTPLYMSPEQAEMSGLDIDTRTDIYSLGVLLYELLTSTTPFDKKRLARAPHEELIRIIREEEPPKPSTRLSQTESLAAIAALRKSEPTRLANMLRGDLDWITMKALEKDRTRRYETASGLAADIQRYLLDEPVEASPPSTGYRLKKLARRHRTALATVTAFVALLIAAVIVSSWLAIRERFARELADRNAVLAANSADRAAEEAQNARQARLVAVQQRQVAETERKAADDQRKVAEMEKTRADANAFQAEQRRKEADAEAETARQVSTFVVDLFRSSDPMGLFGSGSAFRSVQRDPASVTVREVLSLAVDRIRHRLKNRPQIRAKLLDALGNVYSSMGLFDQANPLVEEALQIRRAVYLGDHPEIIDSLSSVAMNRVLQFDYSDETFALLRQAVKMRRRISPNGSLELATALQNLAFALANGTSGNVGEAESLWRECLNMRQKLLPRGHRDIGLAMLGLAQTLLDQNRMIEAGPFVAAAQEALGNEPIARVLQSAVKSAMEAGTDKWNESAETMRICIANAKPLLGDSHPWVNMFLAQRAYALVKAGDRAAAIQAAKEAAQNWDRLVKRYPSNPTFQRHMLSVKEQLARILDQDGHREESQALRREVSSLAKELASKRVPGLKRSAPRTLDRVTGADGGIDGQSAPVLKGQSLANSLAYSPDGEWIVSASDGQSVEVWQTSTGQKVQVLTGHGALVTCVAFCPDGKRIVSGSADATVKIWDVPAGTQTVTLVGHTGVVTTVAVCPDGKRIASGSDDGTIKIWDLATARAAYALNGHKAAISVVAFGHDGKRLASGSWDRTIKIWDTSTGKETVTLKEQRESVTGLAFSPDGKWIVSGSADGWITNWDTNLGTIVRAYKGHEMRVSAISFSPDGKQFASGSGNGAIKVWDTSTGREVFTIKGHSGDVTGLTFSPDGKRIASRSSDATIKIWEASSGEANSTFQRGHASERVGAEWALRLGAVITLSSGAEIHSVSSLPTDHVTVKEVKFPENQRQVNNDGLATLSGMRGLQVLAIRGSRITDAGLRHIAQLKTLKSLNLHATGISDEGLKSLGELKELTLLDLGYNHAITDAGMLYLRGLINLEHLNVYGTTVGDDTLHILSSMKQLNYLEAQHTLISNSGLKDLKGFTKLHHLVLSKELSSSEVASLRKALPNCAIELRD